MFGDNGNATHRKSATGSITKDSSHAPMDVIKDTALPSAWAGAHQLTSTPKVGSEYRSVFGVYCIEVGSVEHTNVYIMNSGTSGASFFRFTL